MTLFLFFTTGILSFSVLTDAGSDNVGAKYFLPDALPILSDLGSTRGFFGLYLVASVSYRVSRHIVKYNLISSRKPTTIVTFCSGSSSRSAVVSLTFSSA